MQRKRTILSDKKYRDSGKFRTSFSSYFMLISIRRVFFSPLSRIDSKVETFSAVSLRSRGRQKTEKRDQGCICCCDCDNVHISGVFVVARFFIELAA